MNVFDCFEQWPLDGTEIQFNGWDSYIFDFQNDTHEDVHILI